VFVILSLVSVEMLKLNVAIAIFALSSIRCSGQSLNYRLPNDSLPLHYDLLLTTDIHRSDFTFSGRVKIHVKILAATQTVTLHSRDIIVDSITLRDTNGAVSTSNLTPQCGRGVCA
jgi:hypothetical protein